MSVVAIVTILLGVGVGTAIFSIVSAILLQPLPYRDPDSLVMLWNLNPEVGYTYEATRSRGRSMSGSEFKAWRDESEIFEQMVAFRSSVGAIFDLENPDSTHGYYLSEGGFEMLGIQPMIGRTPTPEEQMVEPSNVLVIRHNLWRRHFNADPNVVGQALELNGNSYQVIGVMPEGFVFYNRQSEFLSCLPLRTHYADPTSRVLRVMARLKEGMTIEEAQRRATEFSAEMERRFPDSNQGWSVKVVSVADETAGPLRPAMRVLSAAVGLVLLIMCVNVACLLLVDVSSRSREFAVRAATGATRWHVGRKLVIESLALAGIGGALGLALGYGLIAYFQSMAPDRFSHGKYLPQLDQIELDGPVALFALAVAVTAGLVVGLLPALRAAQPNLTEELKEGGRGSSGSRGQGLRNSLVVVEVALGLVLMTSASLLVRSLLQLHARGSGLRPEGVLTMMISQPRGVHFYDAIDRGMDFQAAFDYSSEKVGGINALLFDSLRRIPSIEEVGVVSRLPMLGWFQTYPLAIEGKTYASLNDYPEVAYKRASLEYSAAVGLPVRQGRWFEPSDRFGDPIVYVINDEAAKRYFPNENPLGRRIRLGGPQGSDPWNQIIGVVGSVREAGMDQPPVPAVYASIHQRPSESFFLTLRTSVDPMSIMPEVRRGVRDCCPTSPIHRVRVFESIVNDSAWRLRYSAVLLSGLAGLGLVLAALGVYGTLSDSLRNRTSEIGIRVALGASRGDIVRMVLKQGLKLVGLGVAIGLAASAVMTRYLESLLFGVTPVDLPTYAFVTAVLVAAGLLASLFPAIRALAIQPVHALRHE